MEHTHTGKGGKQRTLMQQQMKSCKDCTNYEFCRKYDNLYHPCDYFEDKVVGNITFCKDCKHLMFSDCYAECGKAYKGIVSIHDFCDKGELR